MLRKNVWCIVIETLLNIKGKREKIELKHDKIWLTRV